MLQIIKIRKSCCHCPYKIEQINIGVTQIVHRQLMRRVLCVAVFENLE